MAGAGFKTFNTGDVLTASDVNTYLMQQTVMVFDDAAARTTALTGVVAEGMMSYLKDTNKTYRYDGSAWLDDAGTTSPLTTKGDVWGYSTTDARIPVGADGTVLTADSNESLGVKWAAGAGWNPDFTLINTGGTSFSGTTTTVSGISGKSALFIRIVGASNASSDTNIYLRFNGDSANNYGFVPTAGNAADSDSKILLGGTGGNAANTVNAYCFVYGTNTTGLKTTISVGKGNGAGALTTATSGFYSGSSAISSVTIIQDVGGNFDAGTIYVYGA